MSRVGKFFARRVLRQDVPMVRLPALMKAAPELPKESQPILEQVAAAPSWKQYDEPAHKRPLTERFKQARDNKLNRQDVLDIPTFLRRQAD